MYFYSIINIFADIAIFWLHASVARNEDKDHPLAQYVTYSAAPYFFNLFPTIMNSALFGLDISHLTDITQALKTFDYIILRDSTFKSIMLCTFIFMIVWSGVLIAGGLICCVSRDRRMSRCELTMRTGIPSAVGMIFSMAFYNGAFDVHEKMRFVPNYPFLMLNLGHLMFIFALAWGTMKIKNLTEPTDNQAEAIRQFQSLQIFGLITSVPMLYMQFQMFSTHSSRFLFSDYDCFVRLVFLAAVLLLEPFNSRFRFRERFYRTAHESPIAPAPDAVQVVKPLPRKMNIDEMTPNYGNAPPAYDDAQSLPTSWTITPPSKEYTGAQMTPVEAK
ncbi:X-BoX promoter element regulated [Caenorhabditis elegans]|uniref:X-BoX promoter element regulated n=1 Tax=Caenorhabditis elegans TaxID=6239 RepID=Q22709_CAEEL|nr:X-BoX promoter element regulated [Caenorhabditis elegans]CAA88881.2 X-BoX promoter element regulated [Caenorhabditis elegans]|eukprot:NP_497768.2 X-BoX promoter element regulated [Caenorhabditis elegans]